MTNFLISWKAPNWATPNHTKYGITVITSGGTVLFNITTNLSVIVNLPDSSFHVEVCAMDDLGNKTKIVSKDYVPQ